MNPQLVVGGEPSGDRLRHDRGHRQAALIGGSPYLSNQPGRQRHRLAIVAEQATGRDESGERAHTIRTTATPCEVLRCRTVPDHRDRLCGHSLTAAVAAVQRLEDLIRIGRRRRMRQAMRAIKGEVDHPTKVPPPQPQHRPRFSSAPPTGRGEVNDRQPNTPASHPNRLVFVRSFLWLFEVG